MAAPIDAGDTCLIAEVDCAFAGHVYASGYRPRAGYRWTVEDSVHLARAAIGRADGGTRTPDGGLTGPPTAARRPPLA